MSDESTEVKPRFAHGIPQPPPSRDGGLMLQMKDGELALGPDTLLRQWCIEKAFEVISRSWYIDEPAKNTKMLTESAQQIYNWVTSSETKAE